MKWNEEKISRLFQIGKQVDEKSIAPFERVLARSWTATPPSRVWVFRFITLFAVVLVISTIAFVLTRSHPADSSARLHETLSVLEWHSPTDFLLRTPGHELRDTLPKVGQPLAFMANSNQAFSHSRGERQ